MIIKSRSSNLRRVSRAHRFDLTLLIEQINLDTSISSRSVHTSEQLVDILTRVAFIAIQWTSLMQLFDIYQQPKLNIDFAFQIFCSAVSQHTPHAISDVYTHQDIESGPWKKNLEDSLAGVENCSAWEHPTHLVGSVSRNLARKDRCHERTVSRSHVENKFSSRQCFFRTKDEDASQDVEQEPRRPVYLGAPRRNSYGSDRRGRPLVRG